MRKEVRLKRLNRRISFEKSAVLTPMMNACEETS
jgi:hypothetical protein